VKLAQLVQQARPVPLVQLEQQVFKARRVQQARLVPLEVSQLLAQLHQIIQLMEICGLTQIQCRSSHTSIQHGLRLWEALVYKVQQVLPVRLVQLERQAHLVIQF
jgi:hypothetical protein